MPRKKLVGAKNEFTQCDFTLKDTYFKYTQVNSEDLGILSPKPCTHFQCKQSYLGPKTLPIPQPILVKASSVNICNEVVKFLGKDAQSQTDLSCNDHNVFNISVAGEIFHSSKDITDSVSREKSCVLKRGLPTSASDILKRKIRPDGDNYNNPGPIVKRVKETSSTTLSMLFDFIHNLNQGDIVTTFNETKNGKIKQLEVTKSSGLVFISEDRYEVPSRLLFSSKGHLLISTIFKVSENFTYLNLVNELDEDVVINALNKLNNEHVFCPGISEDLCQNTETKNLEKISYPSTRFQAHGCLVWYAPPSNVQREELNDKRYQCGKCRYLQRYIVDQKRKREDVTPRTKQRNLSVRSSCRISILTPRSRSKRMYNNRSVRFSLNKKVKQLEKKVLENMIKLNEKQDNEMRQLVTEVNCKGKEDLEEIFKMANSKNKMLGLALRKAWETNSKQNDFSKDQERNRKGSTGNRWSPLTYRIALAVYSRSKAAYEALASFDILNLPSVYSVQEKARKIPCQQGIDLNYLQSWSIKFDEHVEKLTNKPPKEGLIIFDEVKTIGKLMWNSKNNEFIGCAITPEAFHSMEDLFKENTVKETVEAEYVIQFLWRAISTKFDIIGPYFMLATPACHTFITNAVTKVIWAFQSVGLETTGIICDGGSNNIASLRHSLGLQKAPTHKIKPDGTYDFSLNPKFRNICFRDRWIHWITCPTHQLKNMINAIHHSKTNDSKDFTVNGVQFGWKQIEDMKKRENDRMKDHELTQVKGLTQAHIDRDPWTKLNVAPALIMQRISVLGELYNYANPLYEKKPKDEKEVMATYDYLFACHKIFEEGLLSHEKVSSLDSKPIKSMLEGLNYFEKWATERLENENTLTDGRFLAWQTWELLRITIYGFIGFIEDFLQRNPTQYVYPVKVNGSAIETIFSQMKYVTGGKLTSLNYQSGMRALVIKNCIKTSQNAEASYRKVGLDILDCDM